MQSGNGGDPHGHDCVPPECDGSIRPGWFWHSSKHPKSALELLDIYYKSVGRNCLLLLNVPPNSSGLISDEDVQVLHDFTKLRHETFSLNLAETATITASSTRGGFNDPKFGPSQVLKEGIYSYWAPEEGAKDGWALYFDFGRPLSFNVLQLQEAIHVGQRVIKYHLDVQKDGEWETIVNGTTVGYKRLQRFQAVESQVLRLSIKKSRADPLISFLGIYLEPPPAIGLELLSFNSCHQARHVRLRDWFWNASKASF
ncbi:hypothetical protein AMTR_s00009p00016290 [Amborella trichopoda]|uniref:F5/8 type C domain-containing protein n=1 Tax=Amborella trichopoda TaxID=13333 RepID=W1NG96_AMBTC|nr:hypothetical protein AMTR_s00009p00016290 [Amborella trichopoda]